MSLLKCLVNQLFPETPDDAPLPFLMPHPEETQSTDILLTSLISVRHAVFSLVAVNA